MLTQNLYNQKNDVFYTSTNHSTSAEWIEQHLQATEEIVQIAVFLDVEQGVCAVIFSSINPSLEQTQKINAAINSTNTSLPEYARIHKWVYAKLPFLIRYQQITCSGRLCRDQIYQDYQGALLAKN